MNAIDVAALVAPCLLLCAALMPPSRRRVAAAVALPLSCVLFAAALVTRWRWQHSFLLAVAVLISIALIVRTRRPRAARGGRLRRLALGSFVTFMVVALVAGLGTLWAAPRLVLPTPSGPHAVGGAAVTWTDHTRPEPNTPDPADHRAVVAQLWFPTDQRSGRVFTYLGDLSDEVADGAAASLGVPRWLLADPVVATTQTLADVPIAQRPGGWPVVVFSPGLNGVRTQDTAWAQELASHGYVVVAVDHPYDSSAVALNGRVVRTTLHSTGNDAADNRAADQATRVRAADLSFVVDRLTALADGRSVPGTASRDREALRSLRGQLDLSRLAAVGHSMGGAAAVLVATQDARFKAVINVDGLPRAIAGTSRNQPVLQLVAGRQLDDGGRYARARAELLATSGHPSAQLVVPGTGHLSFTDAALYLPPLPSLFGTGGRHRGLDALNRASLVFLATTLNPSAPRCAGPGGWGQTLGALGEVTLQC